MRANVQTKLLQLFVLSALFIACSCYEVRRLEIFNESDSFNGLSTNSMRVAVSDYVIGFYFPEADMIMYYPKTDFLDQVFIDEVYTRQYVKK